jgi:RNA polymerase sigma factor (sigma-70 family)
MARVLSTVDADSAADRLTPLFEVHQARLYRLARRLAPTRDDALDLVQETFLRAARSPKSIPIGITEEEAWLVRVLINIRRDQWRKTSRRHRLRAVALGSNQSHFGAGDAEAALIARTAVWQALDILPPRRRAIPAIASLLGISAVTVRWHLSKGGRELAGKLKAYMGNQMKDVRELLREADPLRDEPTWQVSRELRLHTFLESASGVRPDSGPSRKRSRRTALFAIAALTIGGCVLGPRIWPIFVGELQAAVLFEVMLADDRPAPGLRQAKVSGSDRSIHLHGEVIVTNGDIAVARAVPISGSSEYSIDIEFNTSGAAKMRAATANHLGKLAAILLNGQVVMAPTLRTPIAASQAQAEKIVKGIEIQ